MEYFNDDGMPKNIISINSLTKEGFVKYLNEIKLLKENNLYDDSRIRARKKKDFRKTDSPNEKYQKEINNRKNIDEFIKDEKNKITDNFVINENADNRFYYFRFIFKGIPYYKIGITSQSLKDRYKKDYKKIEKILYNEKIDGAMKIEKELKERFKESIFPLAYLNGGGHTEIFDRDILELDY